jgi:hypothetical protein
MNRRSPTLSARVDAALNFSRERFDDAIAFLRRSASALDEREREVLAARQGTMLAEGYIAAIYHVSRTPLLDAHPDVRKAVVQVLESEMNHRCGEPPSVDAVDPHAPSTGTPSTRDEASSSSCSPRPPTEGR